MAIPSLIPAFIPAVAAAGSTSPALPSGSRFSLYDVSIGGIYFNYASTSSDPSIRQTAPFEKQRIDQEETPGEQTLTGWWFRSQESFHGGAGQLQLEPAVPTPTSHVRFDASKNVDVFTPGQVTRLPDTVAITSGSETAVGMLGITVSGADALVYCTTAGAVKMITSLDSTPSTGTFSGTDIHNVSSITTDGLFVYAATGTGVYRLTPGNLATQVHLVDYPASATDAVVSWQKARLMLGVSGAVYAGIEGASAHTLVAAGTDAYFFYNHPTVGFHWRCFAESPTAILAAGDAGGVSIILQFDTTSVSGVPTLQPDGQIASMPIGERILSMLSNEGGFLGIGTTKGFRVGEYDPYFSRLSYGPLTLLPTDPTIPCNQVMARDRFLFAAGLAYDEGGLIAVDLGTKTDDAGRFAWSSHLITPAVTTTPATAGCTLPVSGRLAFYVAGTGIVLEGVDAGTGREAWLRTSRIRYGTTEPKLFKLGRLRGELTSGDILVEGITSTAAPTVLGTVGFTTIDPTEFRLPTDSVEWLQLKMTLMGADTTLTSYQVKALPGTRRQRHIQPVLSLFDNETTRNGVEFKAHLSARSRLAQLEALDSAGDEVLYQEFTPNGVISTIVVIEQLEFKQIARPTQTSDVGGIATVLLRTVES